MIERWHRSLKAAIMCHSDREWSRSLSAVLLGLRTNVSDRVYEIDVNGVPRHVSIENVKSAHFMRDDLDQFQQSNLDAAPVLRT